MAPGEGVCPPSLGCSPEGSPSCCGGCLTSQNFQKRQNYPSIEESISGGGCAAGNGSVCCVGLRGVVQSSWWGGLHSLQIFSQSAEFPQREGTVLGLHLCWSVHGSPIWHTALVAHSLGTAAWRCYFHQALLEKQRCILSRHTCSLYFCVTCRSVSLSVS